MVDNSKKLSELPTTSNVAASDRVLVLRTPSANASTRTITVDNLTSSIRYANTTVAGLVKVGNNLSINSTGYLSTSGAAVGNINFANIASEVVPATTNTFSLGNSTNQWQSLHVSSNTIYIGNNTLSISGGVLVVNGDPIGNVQFVTPNIAYTGVFNGYPASLSVSKGLATFFTGNNYVLDTVDKYWLTNRFDTSDYDLSGTETLDFFNIGGIDDRFRLGGKSETLLTDVNLHDIAVINDYFYLRDLPALETFSANGLVYVDNYLQIDNMDNANTQFNFPNLKTIRGNFYYTYNDVLENTPQFPALETVGNMYIYYNSATQNTMTFDSLQYVGYCSIYQNQGMVTGPEFPALTAADYIDIHTNNMANPPSFPLLETVNGSFYFYANPNVTTAPATPSLVSSNYIGWYDNPSMVNGFSFDSLTSLNGAFDVSGCALDEASIDYVLSVLVGLDGTNGTTLYQNRTVNLGGGTNAAPSASGLMDVATLEARGCVVYHN